MNLYGIVTVRWEFFINITDMFALLESLHTHTHTHIYIYICVCVCVNSEVLIGVWINRVSLPATGSLYV